MSPDGRWLVAGNDAGALLVWDLGTGRMHASMPDAHLRAVHRVRFSRDGAVVVSASADAFSKVWALDALVSGDVQPQHTFSDHTKAVVDVCVGFGSRFDRCRAVTCSADATCCLYDLADGALLGRFSFPAALTCVAMNAAETLLLAGAEDGNIYLVDLGGDQHEVAQAAAITINRDASGAKLCGAGSPVVQMSWAADESLLVSGDRAGNLTVWDVASRLGVRQIATAAAVPNGAVRWLQVVPRAALTRSEPPRAFGQLRRSTDAAPPAAIEATVSLASCLPARQPAAAAAGDADELARLREENEQLRQAHRRLLDSIAAD